MTATDVSIWIKAQTVKRAKTKRMQFVREVTKTMNIVMDYLDDRRDEFVSFSIIQDHVFTVAPRLNTGAIITAVGMLRQYSMVWPLTVTQSLNTQNSFKIAN